MTRSDHLSGTDRAAEVASAEHGEMVVNIQGDEPLIDPAAIDAAVLALSDTPAIPMSTLKKRIEDPTEITNPNVVKVVTDLEGNAVYFSRAAIPAVRDGGAGGAEAARYKHTGVYVYRREFLLAYPQLPIGPLEQAERLEQLRAIENGYNYGSPRRTTNPSASIRPKTWSGSRGCLKSTPAQKTHCERRTRDEVYLRHRRCGQLAGQRTDGGRAWARSWSTAA